MHAKRFSAALALASIATLWAALSTAEARPRRVVAHGSGFLDLSERSRIAGRENYVIQSTILNRPVYSTFLPDSFGNSVLPGRFGGIGR